MSIGKNITKYRELAGFTQKQLAEKMGVTPTCLNYYEKDKRTPDAEAIKILAGLLNVSGDQLIGLPLSVAEPLYSAKERNIIHNYRKLDTYGKDLVDTVLNKEYNRVLEQQEEEQTNPEYIQLPFYDDKAAAGTGYPLNDNGYEMIRVVRTRNTERADFVVTVFGDSMEPEFSNGDKVLVHSQPDVYEGEIGIFIVNGEGVIKKKGKDRLISLNPRYKDIYPVQTDTFKCAGKVIGKLSV